MAVFLPARDWCITLVGDPAVFAQPFPGNLLGDCRRLTDQPFELFIRGDYDPTPLVGDPRVKLIREVWYLLDEELRSLLGVGLPEEFSGQLLDNAQVRGLLYTDYDTALADLARVYPLVAHLLTLRNGGSVAAQEFAEAVLAGNQSALPELANLLQEEGDPLAELIRQVSAPSPSEWTSIPRGPGSGPPVVPLVSTPPPLAAPVQAIPLELKPVRTFHHSRTVPALAFAPDGGQLATACCDGYVRLWDRSTGQLVREWSLEGLASAVAFSPDGTLLAGGNTEGDLFVWELPAGRERFFRHSWQGAFFCLAFSPDGGMIASANQRGSVSLWDAGTGGDRGQLTGHRGRVWSVSFAQRQEDTVLASGAEDGTTRLWDPSTRQEVGVLPPSRDQVTCVAWTADGQRLAVAALEQGVRIWTFEKGRMVEQTPITPANPAHAVTWARGGERLALIDAGGMVQVWSIPRGDPVGRCLGQFQAHPRPAHTLAFAPESDGVWLASGGEEGAVHLWSLPVTPARSASEGLS